MSVKSSTIFKIYRVVALEVQTEKIPQGRDFGRHKKKYIYSEYNEKWKPCVERVTKKCIEEPNNSRFCGVGVN